MVEVCAQAKCAVVVMHMLGNPQTMQHAPHYDSVIDQVRNFFKQRFVSLTKQGIEPTAICFDPGIGFGKTLEHNLALIRGLSELRFRDRPLLLGVSRKSMIGTILNREDPHDRDWGTVALTALGRKLGAEIHRVHEVKKNAESMRMMEAIMQVEVRN